MRKLKSNPENLEEFRRKERLRHKKYRDCKREIFKINENALKKKRKYDRNRQVKLRKFKDEFKNRNKDCASTSQPYKSRSTFGKALAKVNRNLPFSPNHRRAIVLEVARTNLLADTRKKLFLLRNKSALKLAQATIDLVKQSYQRNSIRR